MEMLERLKTRLDAKDNSQDDILELLLLEAKEHILSYTRRKETQWIPAFNNVQVQIAVINYGRLGMEGVQSRREGDISTAFLGVADYPDSIVKTLDSHRLIKGL